MVLECDFLFLSKVEAEFASDILLRLYSTIHDEKVMTDIAIQPKFKFYTTGFSGRDIGDLNPMLDALSAVLVDVRFSPTNDSMRW